MLALEPEYRILRFMSSSGAPGYKRNDFGDLKPPHHDLRFLETKKLRRQADMAALKAKSAATDAEAVQPAAMRSPFFGHESSRG